MRVLLIDDDEVDRLRITRLLKETSLPIQLHEAKTGGAALMLLKVHEYDCVLLSFRLMDMPGLDLLETLAEETDRISPVVMLAGYQEAALALKALRLDLFDVLQKEELSVSRLEAVIANAQSRRRNARSHVSCVIRDQTTGLFNATYFNLRLQDALCVRPGGRPQGALFVIKPFDLTALTIRYGPAAAEALLCQCAHRLLLEFRRSDLKARLRDSLFAVLLNQCTGEDVCLKIAEKIKALFEQPLEYEGDLIGAELKIGIAEFPKDGASPEDLLNNALLAIESAEADADVWHCFMSAVQEQGIAQRQQLHNGLSRAILQDHLLVHYQPQIALDTNRVTGIEALVRWNDPKRGLVPAAQFIGVAEDTGLVSAIDCCVLSKVCADLSERVRHDLPVYPAGINISPLFFQDSQFKDIIERILAEHHLPADLVEIEITERMAIDDIDLCAHIVADLRALGVHVTLDDFGVGYSSLYHLTKLPVTRVKIDRSFVVDLGRTEAAAATVHAVLNLCADLNIDVVAEGIETEMQRQMLMRLGCRVGQGNLIGPPGPLDRVLDCGPETGAFGQPGASVVLGTTSA